MLLLVTLALVVASAVLLILGFVRDALGFIYVSMLCAGVAAVALFVFARLARRRSAALAGAGIAGGTASPFLAGESEDATSSRRSAEVDRTRGMPVVAAPVYEAEEVDVLAEGPADVTVVAAVPVRDRGLDPWPSSGDQNDDWGDEVIFPIEDYDELRVAEILPLLGQLEPDELHEVRDREVAGKARATILDRIDDRLGRSAAAPLRSTGGAGGGAGAAAGAGAGVTGGAKRVSSRQPAAKKAAPRRTAASSRTTGGAEAPARVAAGRKSAAGKAAGTGKASGSAAAAAAAGKSAAGKTAAARKSVAGKAAAPRQAAAAKAATPGKATAARATSTARAGAGSAGKAAGASRAAGAAGAAGAAAKKAGSTRKAAPAKKAGKRA